MIIIQTAVKSRFNQTVSLNGHLVTFDEEGKSEISIDESNLEEMRAFLAKHSIQISGTAEAKKDGGKAAQKLSVEANTEGANAGDVSDISGMTVKQLKELCKEAELPEEDWKDLRKEDLIHYIDLMTSSPE